MMEMLCNFPLYLQGCDLVAENAASNGFIGQFTTELTTAAPSDHAEALVIGVEATDDGPVITAPELDDTAVTSLHNQLEALGVKGTADEVTRLAGDRKSTRLNSSHVAISYAVFFSKQKR